MKPVSSIFNSHRIPPAIPHRHISLHSFSIISPFPSFFLQIPPSTAARPLTANSHQVHLTNPKPSTQDDGIPLDLVKVLVKFKSRYNYIRVLEVSRKADHPFSGSRLLLLDGPGNIHSINFTHRILTETYFDVFAMLPPILPSGPIGILGFGAGSAAKLILELYPEIVVHGWEIDPFVIDVGREYFELSRLEKDYADRLFIYVDDALNAGVEGGFAGILVDLFCKGSLVPELQDPVAWEKLNKSLKEGGRIMVNVGGSCVEAEGSVQVGKYLMEDTLKAMSKVFEDQLYVLSLGNRNEDSSVALTGSFPDFDVWKEALYEPLGSYVDLWTPFRA